MKGRDKKWGYAVKKGGDETYDILFGPKDRDTIVPEAVFRYEAHDGTWKCETSGDHLRMLKLKNVWNEIIKLGGPLVSGAQAAEVPSTESGISTVEQLDQLPEVRQSKPYKRESLAGLGDAELLVWMGQGRSPWDVMRERIPSALPPDFWFADPKVAALEFVARHRPKKAEQNYRLAFDDLDGLGAPVEGRLDVSTRIGREHSIAEDYCLRCSREDSSLTVVRHGGPWDEKDPLRLESECDLRKISLTYEEARRVVQTVWWLDRVRSKWVGDDNEGAAGLGPEDAAASFQLATPQGKIEWNGSRDMYPEPIAISETDNSYGRTACLNLVALLVCEELPNYLAERWTQFDIQKHQVVEGVPELRTDYSPKQIEELEAGVAEQLRLFTSGNLGRSAATRLVEIAKDLDLRSVRPELEKMRASLTAPSINENRLREIAREVLNLRKRLGVDGSDAIDYLRRQNNLVPSDPKFAPLDALYAKQEKLEEKQSPDEKKTKELRDQIDETLRWFSIEDDPQKLYEFATENIYHMFAGCRRLRVIDPARAIAALEYWKGRETSPDDVQELLQVMDLIQSEMRGVKENASDDEIRAICRIARVGRTANAEMQVGGLIAAAADTSRYGEDREKAMDLLVPANNPRKFPDPVVDDFLAHFLTQTNDKSEWLKPQACLALARRGGGRWWDLITSKPGQGSKYYILGVTNMLPALVTIAVKEGEPFRGKLRDFLTPHLARTNGNLDCILWAAWTADLRELKPEIEKLATSNPADVESPLGKSPSNAIIAARGRLHAARQIASLWNEEDPATRAKMLIALGCEQGSIFGEDPGAERLKSALALEVGGLSPEKRRGVREFVDWCANNAERVSPSSSGGGPSEWLSKVRESLETERQTR
jgi:hypothetical protein